MICSICGEEMSEDQLSFPNNAWPVKEREDPCCDKCYTDIVAYYNMTIRILPTYLKKKMLHVVRNMTIEELRTNARKAKEDYANL